VNGTDGMRLNSGARPNGVVRVAAAGSSGSWYVGGDFTSTGGEQQPYFARFSGTP
jgi:hypothetical protein